LPGILELRQGDGEGMYEDHTFASHRHLNRPGDPQPLQGRGSWSRELCRSLVEYHSG